jgi:hypothetical protein
LDGTIEGDSVPLEFNTRVDYLVEKDGQQFRFQYRKYAA